MTDNQPPSISLIIWVFVERQSSRWRSVPGADPQIAPPVLLVALPTPLCPLRWLSHNPSPPHKKPSTHIHSLSLPLPPAIALYPAPGLLFLPYPLSLCLAVPWSPPPPTPHPMNPPPLKHHTVKPEALTDKETPEIKRARQQSRLRVRAQHPGGA